MQILNNIEEYKEKSRKVLEDRLGRGKRLVGAVNGHYVYANGCVMDLESGNVFKVVRIGVEGTRPGRAESLEVGDRCRELLKEELARIDQHVLYILRDSNGKLKRGEEVSENFEYFDCFLMISF